MNRITNKVRFHLILCRLRLFREVKGEWTNFITYLKGKTFLLNVNVSFKDNHFHRYGPSLVEILLKITDSLRIGVFFHLI